MKRHVEEHLRELARARAEGRSLGALDLPPRRIMTLWTVYDHPSDYPQSYVARQFVISGGKAEPTMSVIMSSDLETLRNTLLAEMHLTCIKRSPNDDPVIIESWL